MNILKIVKQDNILHVMTGDGITFTVHGTINLDDDSSDFTVYIGDDFKRTSYEGFKKYGREV